MADQPIVLTIEGKAKYEKQLQYLKATRRPEISERIRTAREFGDISENAEYENAKREQAFVEGEISEIEKLLKSATLIDKNNINTDEVSLGTIVTVLDVESGEKFSFEIVGSRETDPKNDRISNVSPLGEALLGKGVNEEADVRSPNGTATWRVLEIRSALD